MDKIQLFNSTHAPANRFGDLRVGWTVRISQKIKEGARAKNTNFEGIIIAKKHGNEAGGSITVRRHAGGYGVEKTFPLRLTTIEKIEVLKTGSVSRAKLLYLRTKSAKEIRKKTRQETMVKAPEKVEAPAEAAAQ